MFAREELSLRVMEDQREGCVKATKPFHRGPFRLYSYSLTNSLRGRLALAFHQIKEILYPTNATLMPVPSKLTTIEPSSVSAHLSTFHRAL